MARIMSTRISAKGLKFISNVVVSLFAAVSLGFFLFAIDRTLAVSAISVAMLFAAFYLMWLKDEIDSISLLTFFFSTTACFYFFSGYAARAPLQAVAIAAFAALSLVLSNYLLNMVEPVRSAEKAVFKVALAIIFTQIFWVLSFVNASQLSKGAITAVLFFNLLLVVRDILEKKFRVKKFAFLSFISIIFLAIIIYRI